MNSTNTKSSLKSQLKKLENELEELSVLIHQKTDALKSLKENGLQTRQAKEYIENYSKEELADIILNGVELQGDYDGDVFFYKCITESESEYFKRVLTQECSIKELENKRDVIREAYQIVKDQQASEKEKYKNPEYIAYLKLKNKFENE